jgi:hypothetical protein
VKYPDTLPWKCGPLKGWGDASIIESGASEPLFSFVKPKSYYTDFPTRIDEYGEKWTVCSTRAAIKAGNYVATDEIKAEIEATGKAYAEYLVQAANLLPELVVALEDMVKASHSKKFSDWTAASAKARELLNKVKS